MFRSCSERLRPWRPAPPPFVCPSREPRRGPRPACVRPSRHVAEGDAEPIDVAVPRSGTIRALRLGGRRRVALRQREADPGALALLLIGAMIDARPSEAWHAATMRHWRAPCCTQASNDDPRLPQPLCPITGAEGVRPGARAYPQSVAVRVSCGPDRGIARGADLDAVDAATAESAPACAVRCMPCARASRGSRRFAARGLGRVAGIDVARTCVVARAIERAADLSQMRLARADSNVPYAGQLHAVRAEVGGETRTRIRVSLAHRPRVRGMFRLQGVPLPLVTPSLRSVVRASHARRSRAGDRRQLSPVRSGPAAVPVSRRRPGSSMRGLHSWTNRSKLDRKKLRQLGGVSGLLGLDTEDAAQYEHWALDQADGQADREGSSGPSWTA